MERITQSVAKRVPLKAYLSSDHISGASSKTIAVVISKNGGAFGNPSAGATNATEISLGWYYVDLSTTDTGTLGPLIVRGTEGTIDPTEITFSVEAASATALAPGIPRGEAYADFQFFVGLTGGGPATGLADGDFTSKRVYLDDNGTPITLTGTITELGDGWYTIDLTDAQTDGANLAFVFDATDCDPVRVSALTVA